MEKVLCQNGKHHFKEIEIGKGRKLKDGKDLAILTFGHPGNFAAAAIRQLRTEDIDPAHYDMRFVKPLDEELLHEVFEKFNKIITVEDGTVVGGFRIAPFLNLWQLIIIPHRSVILGIPDIILEHGSPKQLQHEAGFDADAIVKFCPKYCLKKGSEITAVS